MTYTTRFAIREDGWGYCPEKKQNSRICEKLSGYPEFDAAEQARYASSLLLSSQHSEAKCVVFYPEAILQFSMDSKGVPHHVIQF